MENFKPTSLKIRVCHYPQIPCKPFIVEVENEREAFLVEQALADQHLFLFTNGLIPDYSNAIIVEVYDDEEKEWVDYYNSNHDSDWDMVCSDFFERSL